MKTTVLAAAISLAAASLAGCATNPADGDVTIFGQDVGVTSSAAIQTAERDIQNFIKSLPVACSQAAAGQGFTASQLAIAKQVMKVPPKAAANLNNIAADIVAVCNGVALATAPLAAQ